MGLKSSLKKIGKQFDKNITRPAMTAYGTLLTGTTDRDEQKARLKLAASTVAAYYTGGMSKQLENSYYGAKAAKQQSQQEEYDAAEAEAWNANRVTNVPVKPPQYETLPRVESLPSTARAKPISKSKADDKKLPLFYIGIGFFIVVIIFIWRK